MIGICEVDPDLMRAILENPFDDTVRLVYADRLEESGEMDRAEFIRAQIELAITEAVDGSNAGYDHCLYEPPCRWHTLRRRERELLDKFEGDWAPQCLGPFAAHSGSTFSFTRGFVSASRQRIADWIGGKCKECYGSGDVSYHGSKLDCRRCFGTGRTPAHGPQIVRAQPIERVEFTDRKPDHWQSWFGWFKGFRSEGIDESMCLPEFLWDMMAKDASGGVAKEVWGKWLDFDTEQQAIDALSAAALVWAKETPCVETPVLLK